MPRPPRPVPDPIVLVRTSSSSNLGMWVLATDGNQVTLQRGSSTLIFPEDEIDIVLKLLHTIVS